MRPPKRIWVIDHWETFKFTESIEGDTLGTRASKEGIRVEKGLPDWLTVSTVCHELSHGILRRYGLENAWEDNLEEFVCTIFEAAFCSLLTDTEMLDYLKSKWDGSRR